MLFKEVSKIHQRRISPYIEEDLSKIVMLAGPRQCGKTTIAKALLKKYSGRYYNWDDDQDRKLITGSVLDFDVELWLFDELHKYRRWRNWLKGKFDKYSESQKIIVTGSARLDAYSRGGDSLQGRYFLHHLHPLTFSEFLNLPVEEDPELFPLMETNSSDQDALQQMMELGGFPEPLFSASARQSKRWRNSYAARLVREDVRDLERVFELSKIETLYHHLPHTVGSVLSINSLREDLEVSFESVRNWINIFDRLYACFRLSPLGGKKILKNIRAVKKEQKLYFWDWRMVEDEAARFENLVAMHLLRFCHWLEDVYGIKAELRYFRDTRRHEVDFVVLKDGKVWMAIETKTSEQGLDSNLRYLLERVKLPYAFQVHLNGNKHWQVDDINGCKITLMPATRFLANLP